MRSVLRNQMNSPRLFPALLLSVVCFRASLPAAAEFAHVTPAEVSNFALLDQQGQLHELRRADARVVVLFFTANGCPVARQSAAKLNTMRETYAHRGVEVWLVNSSVGDDRAGITKEMRELKVPYLPVLKDDTQGLARHLGVTRTAEAIAISTKDWTVFYRGALDDQAVEGAQKPEPTQRYLETALEEHLAGKAITVAKSVARGCAITLDGGEGPDAAPVSYARDVAPILERKCVSCHSPGHIGSWSMNGHRKIKSMARMIEEVILTRRMPPWGADPAIGKFHNDASLSTEDAKVLLRWVHQGAPRGEGDDPMPAVLAKLGTAAKWPLGEPDIVVKLPKPQEIPATGVLKYRYLQAAVENPTDAWIGGVWVRPGNSKVVHHVIVRLKEPGQKDNTGRNEMVLAWAPGATQGQFPENSGKFLPANSTFVFEMHYTTNGAPQTDQTEVGLYLLKQKPSKRFESLWVTDQKFEIRPGEMNSAARGMYGFTRPATLHSVTPHMHLRGRSMTFEMLLPNGRRELLASVPQYDFNWQITYHFVQPKKVPAGAWAYLTGMFDNSARNPANPDPHAVVHWGQQSFDEMFLGWYNVTWDMEPGSVAARAEQ
jgi:hypothetical protein